MSHRLCSCLLFVALLSGCIDTRGYTVVRVDDGSLAVLQVFDSWQEAREWIERQEEIEAEQAGEVDADGVHGYIVKIKYRIEKKRDNRKERVYGR